MNFNDKEKLAERILRLQEVKFRTGLSRSSIYLAIKNNLFPRPVNLGIRSVGLFFEQAVRHNDIFHVGITQRRVPKILHLNL